MEHNLYQKDNAAMSGKSLCSIAWTIFTHFPTFSCAETIKLDLDCQTALAWAVCLPWAPQGPTQKVAWGQTRSQLRLLGSPWPCTAKLKQQIDRNQRRNKTSWLLHLFQSCSQLCTGHSRITHLIAQEGKREREKESARKSDREREVERERESERDRKNVTSF